MTITQWMHRHRRSLLFLALILAIGGIAGAFNLPVSLFPNVSFPRVRVTLDAGDQPAAQMVVSVTRPVEEAIRRVRGVREVRSTTSRGSAEINVGFDWGADMGRALLDVDAAIGEALPNLPPGLNVEAIRLDPTDAIAYSNRGLARLDRKDYTGAIADYDEALKLTPRSAWSLYGRGIAKRHKGLTKEGDADIAAATAIAPELPERARKLGIS